MASSSTQPVAATKKSILAPVMTLEGHELFTRKYISSGEEYTSFGVTSISYFPDGKEMISGSQDKSTRRWNLRTGKEIETARDVYEKKIFAVAVSRDGRWVVTGGDTGELRVKGGIVRTFEGHSKRIDCIDISVDSTLLASGSEDYTARIWSLATGKLVAGPFKSDDMVGAVRFSSDSKKLAVMSDVGLCLEVWDVQTQKLDARKGGYASSNASYAPIFWTDQNKTIVAIFCFTHSHYPKTIHEFDALTLETVGAPFKGHTDIVNGLALSFDYALLASASRDGTIKLWAFESRQLLASFDVQNAYRIILSPDSRQLAYTTFERNSDNNIYVCDTPTDILARIYAQEANTSEPENPPLANQLNFDMTRRNVGRNPATSPVISYVRRPQRQLPTVDPQQSTFLRYLRRLLPFRTNAVPPVRNDQPRDLLDFPATLALPHNRFPLAEASTRGHSHRDHRENSRPTPGRPTTLSSSAIASDAGVHRLLTLWPFRAGHALPPIVDVPLAPGQLRIAMAGAPAQDDDDLIRDEDYVPDPNSQPPSAGAHINARVHGIGPVVWLLSLTYLLAMVVAHHMRLFCMIASELNQTTRSVVFVQMCAWFRSLSRNGSAFLRAGPRVGFVPTRTLQLPPW